MSMRFGLMSFVIIATFISCNKSDLIWNIHRKIFDEGGYYVPNKNAPKVNTGVAGSVTESAATVPGDIHFVGTSEISAHGHCWSLRSKPTLDDFSNNLGPRTSTGIYSSSLTGLEPNTRYFVRAYAGNAYGISYGSEIEFTTSEQPPRDSPNLTTTSTSNVTETTATVDGDIKSLGASEIISYGHCWSSSNQSPTVLDSKTDLGARNSTGIFSSNLTGLLPNTRYYVRAYATNLFGISYGSVIELVTLQPPARLVYSNDCSSLNGINSAVEYSGGFGRTTIPWTVDNSPSRGYNGAYWLADLVGVSGTGPVGTHWVEFTWVFNYTGYLTFWLRTPGGSGANVANAFPIIYVDGMQQNSASRIMGSLLNDNYMQIQTDDIMQGSHKIKIEFQLDYYTIRIDELRIYER